jgi:very-short-patch-repair endonuclease
VPADRPGDWRELLDLQHGVIARWQVAQRGHRLRLIESQLRNGRWQPLYRGVYACFTGPPSRMAVLWGVVLRAGPGAVLSHHTAAELDKLTDQPASTVHVTITSTRRVSLGLERVSPAPRIVVHRSARVEQARHPSRTPPRTRIEETTLDLTQAALCADDAVSWVIQACSRRLTTPVLLRSAMAVRPQIRWRAELAAAVGDADAGIHSKLEARYVRSVERPHRLPSATRQARSKTGIRTRYLDNHYQEFGVAVELDGQAAHPAEARWRDIHRDNASAAAGIVTLRYSWADVTTDPCRVAAEIGQVLRGRGWTGQLRPCGPGCAAGVS